MTLNHSLGILKAKTQFPCVKYIGAEVLHDAWVQFIILIYHICIILIEVTCVTEVYFFVDINLFSFLITFNLFFQLFEFLLKNVLKVNYVANKSSSNLLLFWI